MTCHFRLLEFLWIVSVSEYFVLLAGRHGPCWYHGFARTTRTQGECCSFLIFSLVDASVGVLVWLSFDFFLEM